MTLLMSWFILYWGAVMIVVAIATYMLSDVAFVGDINSQVGFFLLLGTFGTCILSLVSRLLLCQYGYCPQTNLLFNDMSVSEHLVFFYRLSTRLRSSTRGEETRAIQHVMAKLDLVPVKDTTAGHLSGSNKRRLMLALSLLNEDVSLLLKRKLCVQMLLSQTRVVLCGVAVSLSSSNVQHVGFPLVFAWKRL
jgi:ABC transporter